MKRVARSLVLTGIAIAVLACGPRFGALPVEDVKARVGQTNVYVYDNNPEETFKKGHVPTARWVNPMEFKESDLPAEKTATLIFYCHNEH